jgi:IS5 family transposase
VPIMLRVHFLQQWFGLSDPAMEEALHETPMYREFAGIESGPVRLPDESTILRFRHLLEAHGLALRMLQAINDTLSERGLMLKTGTVVDATLIAAPSSTKNASGERDPEMHQTKKGKQWYFGMKAHIGVDANSGLVHSVIGTAANVCDLNVAGALLHGEEKAAFGDAGYQGVHKRDEALGPTWHVALRPAKRRQLDKTNIFDAMLDALERMKASVRAKVEHPFRVLKRQFGFTKVRYRGITKNTAQLQTLFALSNLWMVRRRLLDAHR